MATDFYQESIWKDSMIKEINNDYYKFLDDHPSFVYVF